MKEISIRFSRTVVIKIINDNCFTERQTNCQLIM